MTLRWLTCIGTALLLAALTSTGYGKTSQELFGDLQAALKEATHDKASPANEEGTNPYNRDALLFQLSSQLASASVQGGREMPQLLFEISANSHSEKVQQICQELSRQLRTERMQREAELLRKTDAAVKHAGEIALGAKSEKDLDAVLQEIGQLREDREDVSSELGRRSSEKLQAANQFVTRWQDYLAQIAAGNPRAALHILSELVNSTSYPIVPRSEILTRQQTLTEQEAKLATAAISPVAASRNAVLASLKEPADIPMAMAQLTALQQQFPGEVNSSLLIELGTLNRLAQQIQAGVSTQVSIGESNSNFSELRLRLAVLALPRNLELPENLRPGPDETPGQFLDRVSAEARKTLNWPLLLKATDAARALAGGSSGRWSSSTNPLRSFIIGQNQEQAGQYALAVVSYEEALRDVDDLVPIATVRDRLAAIRQQHAADFDEGMGRVLNPPTPMHVPNDQIPPAHQNVRQPGMPWPSASPTAAPGAAPATPPSPVPSPSPRGH